jgi:hypothetical protein
MNMGTLQRHESARVKIRSGVALRAWYLARLRSLLDSHSDWVPTSDFRSHGACRDPLFAAAAGTLTQRRRATYEIDAHTHPGRQVRRPP